MHKKSLIVLGLNSGTSADGVDLAAVNIKRADGKVVTSFLKGSSTPYPDVLRTRVLNLADLKATTLDEVIATDNAIGKFFGQTARSFLRRLDKEKVKVDAVASHGQTVRHLPSNSNKQDTRQCGTMQLGSLSHIAALTGKVTVGNFRQGDIAVGNEGAPITVAAMQRMFGSPRRSCLIVNIGGMSNYFYFPSLRTRIRAMAADCGPGNSLCDILSEMLFNKKFDRNGEIARKGKVSKRLLSLLLAEPFFQDKMISTGRETFGKEYCERLMKLARQLSLNSEDMISTAAELTVTAVVDTIKPLLKKDKSLKKLYLTGGGRKNRFFVQGLKEKVSGVEVLLADELGIDADYIEAAAYAVMGEATLRSEPLQTTSNSMRQKVLPVLGSIVQPPLSR